MSKTQELKVEEMVQIKLIRMLRSKKYLTIKEREELFLEITSIIKGIEKLKENENHLNVEEENEEVELEDYENDI